MKFKIFPPIGIARIGDSPDEWFIGPEIPGAYQRPEGGYKSADCLIKRQAARFRVFAYEDDGQTPILENGRPREITAADAQITWTVQLGNTKASADRFLNDGGPIPRNPDVKDRKSLEIVTDELSISGAGQSKVFKPGLFRGLEVPLGELRTDEAGRLIVLGGFGLSRAVDENGKPWPKSFLDSTNTFALYDNKDWHDDTSDGPVKATVSMGGQTLEAMPARVLVTPPAFAPAIQPMISLYDRMRDELVDPPGPIKGPFSFNHDIYPLLRRARDIGAVFDMGSETPHYTLRTAADDPTAPSGYLVSRLRPPGGTSDPLQDMPRLIDDNKEGFVLTRRQYAALQAWADQSGQGEPWINDWTGAPPLPDPFVTPDGLTRAALEACVGRGLRPGIEVGRFLFGGKTGATNGAVPKSYDPPEYLESFRLAALPPGKVTEMMAVPWQRDFYNCSREGIRAWWPTHRPDKVYSEAGGGQEDWFTGPTGDEPKAAQWLIDNFNQFGFVVEKAGRLLSTERNLGCRELSVIPLRNPVSRHQVAAALAEDEPDKGRIKAALEVAVDGCKPSDLGFQGFQWKPKEIEDLAPKVGFFDAQGQPVLDIVARPVGIAVQVENLAQAQVIAFTYDLDFSGEGPFFENGQPATARVLTVAAMRDWQDGDKSGLATGDGKLTLVNVDHPYIDDGPTEWLSRDLRVFRVVKDADPIGVGKIGGDAAAALDYIDKVVTLFNSPQPGQHPFDKLTENQQDSALRLTTLEGDKPVFNFAVARVRYPGKLLPAHDVRVFFRMFTTAATGFDYDPEGPYRRTKDMETPRPLLGLDGVGNIVTFPCFGRARVDSAAVGLDMQDDDLNVRTLAPAPQGGETIAYFGCWIDNNQTTLQFPEPPDPETGPWPAKPGDPTGGRKDLIQLVNGEHHCLVAEIAYGAAPIPLGATPGGDKRIAQRNLVWVESDNPGGPDTRTIQHSFAIKAPPRDDRRLRPDELIIHWSGLPAGCRMRLYMPDVAATEVLRLAAAAHDYAGLARLDAHTLDCLPGGRTYVPLPDGRSRDIAALLTVELPEGVRKGQQFQVRVEQRAADRRVQGAFQINIPISTARALLPGEKRRLSLLRYVALGKTPDDPWAAVLRRYIDQVAARVRGYGGDPDAIAPSPTGQGETGKAKAMTCRLLAAFFAIALGVLLAAAGLHPLPVWLPETVTGIATLVIGLLWLLVCKPPPWRLLLATGAAFIFGAGLLGVASLIGHGSPVLPLWLAASAVAGALLLGLGILLKPQP